ncbi:MAG: lytic transglycosylase domain-containing protein, partial [Bdellovibrionales bacterium]|nr:lytic transglycosylase domain-containing protein [Bdellovibrionales bacterium]
SDGAIRFSNRPPSGGQNAKVFKSQRTGFSWYRMSRGGRSDRLYPDKFDSIIRSAAQRHGVDHCLVRAVVHAESGFNPEAVSPKGALGLMQIMPFNLRTLGIRDPFDPVENIGGGTKFLGQLLDRYRGDVRFALAAYNAGAEAVSKYKGIPPYTETQNYVRRVESLWRRYQKNES